MGVQSLWTLLEPCGRRVNIEALTNKRLAVDASIWIFQFMQTMRDSRGEMLRNAHILGFFRRICRLLFHRVRPIFVFDGATPPLKRRTTIARRRRREQQTAKLRKTAEKLLMAQLKKHALQTDTSLKDNQEEAGFGDAQPSKGNPTAPEQALDAIREAEDEGEPEPPDTAQDAILARQLAEELEGGLYAKEMMGHLEAGNAAGIKELTKRAASAVVTSPAGHTEEVKIEAEEGDDDKDMDNDDSSDDEEVVVPEGVHVDPAVLSTLPPSMQLDLMTKIRDNKIYENRAHFQKHAAQPLNFSSFQIQEYLKASTFRRQIDGLKDTMNASVLSGVEGAIARRIAADEGREYILQREEPDKPGLPKAAMPAEVKAESNRSALEISLDLTGQKKVDLDSIILNSPEQQKTSSSEEEWLDVDTGEPASALKVKKEQEAENEDMSPDGDIKKPKDWRERKAQRQKYWSLSQGFRFGRKLAEWGEEPPARQVSGHAGNRDGVEAVEMQEAIRRSLMEAPAGQAELEADKSDNEGDQLWQGLPPPDQAGPSGSTPAADGSSAAHAISLAAGAAAASSAPSPLPAARAPTANGSSIRSRPEHPAASSSAAHKHCAQQDPENSSQPLHDQRPEGTVQRARKRIRLPTLAEGPLKERAAQWDAIYSKPSLSLPAGSPAAKKDARADTDMSLHETLAHGPARHKDKTHGMTVAPAAQSDGPVAAALRQALTMAEDEASDDDSSIQEIPNQQITPSRLAGDSVCIAQPATAQHSAPPVTAAPSGGRSRAEGGETGVNAASPQMGDNSRAAALPDIKLSRIGSEQRKQSMPVACDVKEELHGKASGSIAFTGPVQDVTGTMPGIPGIPGSLTAGKPAVLGAQPKEARTKPVCSDADGAAERAAAAEEELRADMLCEEQQEPPEEDGPCADPWAEDPWGQGNLWEDPGAGLPFNGPPPVASRRPSNSTGPKAGQPPQEQPAAVAFNMDAELLELEQQTKKLKASHRKQAGTTESPTTDMYGDCQELLQLFGLPYIIAPAEAEAQCAWLDAQGLVDGVVTDDNDAFLFGAKHIYRHIFEGRKYVEEYHTSDVERELGMDRLGLICLALLLGSDYTEGVAGIGIVNAVEVVRAFRGEGGMRQFREWVMNPDEEELREAAQPKPKRGRKQGADAPSDDAAPEDEGQPHDEKALRDFKRSHRQMRRNWDLPSKFPDIRVIDAYRKPSLDESKERFTYGRPDAQLIRNFCLEKFGWTFEKVDEILDPVLKAYDARQTQATMDSFLAFNERFAKIRSKRLQQAVKGISKAPNPEMMEDYAADTPKPARKRSKKGKANGLNSTPGSADPASQLGVFADRSESDEELLEALTPVSLTTPQRGRGKGQRARGSGRKPTAPGGRAEKKKGKAGRGRPGRAGGPDPKDPDASKPVSQNTNTGDMGDDIDWEPAS